MATFDILSADPAAVDPAKRMISRPGAADVARLRARLSMESITLTTTGQAALDVSTTWNGSGQTLTALRVNATDTASAGGSLLADFQRGAVSQFSVTKTGAVNARGSFNSLDGTGTTVIQMSANAAYGFHMAATHAVSWCNSAILDGSIAISLFRDAANTLSQRNGAAAQTFRLERTFSDPSNRGYTDFRQDATTGLILDSVNSGLVGAPTYLLDVRGAGATSIRVAANGVLQFAGSTDSFPSLERAGNELRLRLAGGGGFSILRLAEVGFGGATSSFPALKYSGTTVLVRLADDSGNADIRARSVIQVPPASITPASNGELVFEATSNTSVTLKLKGSDGTVRSAALTLA